MAPSTKARARAAAAASSRSTSSSPSTPPTVAVKQQERQPGRVVAIGDPDGSGAMSGISSVSSSEGKSTGSGSKRSPSPPESLKHSPAQHAATAVASGFVGTAHGVEHGAPDASALWDKHEASPPIVNAQVSSASSSTKSKSPSGTAPSPPQASVGLRIPCELSAASSSSSLLPIPALVGASSTAVAVSASASAYYQQYRQATATALTSSAAGTSALVALSQGHRYASVALGKGKSAAQEVLMRMRSKSAAAASAGGQGFRAVGHETHEEEGVEGSAIDEPTLPPAAAPLIDPATASSEATAKQERISWSSFDRIPHLMIESTGGGGYQQQSISGGKQRSTTVQHAGPVLFICREPSGLLQAWAPDTDGLSYSDDTLDSEASDLKEIMRVTPSALLKCAGDSFAEARPLAARFILRKEPNSSRHTSRLHLLIVVRLHSTDGESSAELWELQPDDLSLVRRSSLTSFSAGTWSGAPSSYASMHLSRRHVVVSLSLSPLAYLSSDKSAHPEPAASIHIHHLSTLQRAFDPLLDTAPPFADRPPALDLSDRLLVYASTSTHLADPSTGSGGGRPHAGFSTARQSRQRLGHSPLSPASHTHGSGTSSSPRRDQQATPYSTKPLLDRAKRVGGSIGSSAWALGASGADFVAHRMGHSFGERDDQASDSSGSASTATAAPAEEAVLSSPSLPAFEPQRTIIRIVDIGGVLSQTPRPIAAFTHGVGAGPISCLRFNGRGDMLFSADTAGQTFVVHGIQLASAFEPSARAVVRPLHKVHRGITSAPIAAACWSRDSQLLHVQSKRGTLHTIAVSRSGSRPDPLGVINARTGSDVLARSLPAEAVVLPVTAHAWPTELDEASATPTSAWPAFTLVDDLHSADARSWRALCFEGRSGSLQLFGKALTARRASISTNAVSRASALTEMINAGKGSWPSGTRSTGSASTSSISMIEAPHPAPSRLWRDLVQPVEDDPSLCLFSKTAARAAVHLPNRGSSVSAAEIDTYAKHTVGRAPHVLISNQFSYYCFSNNVRSRTQDACDVHRAGKTRLYTRIQPQVKAPSDPTFSRNSPSSFDDGLGQAFLNAGWQNPDTVIPSFPQGATGRTPGWTQRALPIRTVATGVSQLRSSLGRGVEAARYISRSNEKRREKGMALSFDEAEYDERTFAEAASIGAATNTSGQSPGMAGSGSLETPLTSLGSEDDMEELELAWQLARGTAEDVEGDEQGYDGFADEEFGGKGLVRLVPSEAKMPPPASDLAEEFLVGVFDEEAEGAANGFVKPKSEPKPATPLSTSLPVAPTSSSSPAASSFKAGKGKHGKGGLRGSALSSSIPSSKQDKSVK